MPAEPNLRVYAWNVNGLRACLGKGFLTWLTSSEADIVGLQEVRAQENQLQTCGFPPPSWYTHVSSGERAGYSGVALLSRRVPDAIETSIDRIEFDREGRVQLATYGKLLLANIYFPNGSGKARDNSRVPYKLAFYDHLLSLLAQRQAAGMRIVVIGDFNTAHCEIDLARPKENRTTSGFLPEECEAFNRWIRAGWVDSLREFDKSPGLYTWWSQRGGARSRNVGWRIDYALLSANARPFLRAAKILPQITGSDHCPIAVELDPKICE